MTARLAPACVALAVASAVAAPVPSRGDEAIRLPVPVIAQAPERWGPASLAMVLRFYGAPDSAVAEAERAHSPALLVGRRAP